MQLDFLPHSRTPCTNHFNVWISWLCVPVYSPIDCAALGSSRQPSQIFEVLSRVFPPLRTGTGAHINLAILKTSSIDDVFLSLGKRETTQVSSGGHDYAFL